MSDATRTTIDITPTWAGILPALIALLQSPNMEARRTATEELTRMAWIADLAKSPK